MRRPHDRTRPRPAATAGAGIALGLALALVACGAPEAGMEEDAAAGAAPAGAMEEARMPDSDGWITLFDGTDLSAWRGYGRRDVPSGWQVQDGLLAFVPGNAGGDLITRDQFGDFELELDWRVGPAGNSGIFYRAIEGLDAIWHGAPELQILDDAGHADGARAMTSAGALYDLYAPTEDVVRPAGEWNEVRVVARGPHVEHWLNGTKIVEFEAWSDDWNARVRDSKFVDYPQFGQARSGHIGLQDHGDPIWFRDIRVRPLDNGGQ